MIYRARGLCDFYGHTVEYTDFITQSEATCLEATETQTVATLQL